MLRNSYIAILFCVFSACISLQAYAGNYVLTQITKESELTDGGSYIICYRNASKKFFNMKGKFYNEERAIEYDSEGKGITDTNELVKKSTVFRFDQRDGYWLLWDTELLTYIGENRKANTVSIMQGYDSPDDNCRVTFPLYNSQLDVRIGGKVVRYHQNIYRYEMRAKQKELDFYQVCIYQVEEEPEPFVLHGEQNLEPIDQTCDITLLRNFFNDHYNTLILPVSINDYQKVFGTDVTAYELTLIKGDSITFTPLKEKKLAANHPYLLKGEFVEAPYPLGHLHILYKGDEPIEQQMGNITVKGTYSHKDVSRQQGAFVLNKGKFYPCEGQNHLIVSPYKWYIIKNQ